MPVARRVVEQPTPASTSIAADQKFAVLKRASRVWAVGAIHGEVERLAALHAALRDRFVSGDRLVYLGNYLGHGPEVTATIDELLRFRREIIARRFMFATDVVYLRGSQEEMWQKLLQLHFAVNPREVLDWVLGQGAAATLRAYGGDPERGRLAAREGAVAIGRWTETLRQSMATRPGHRNLMSTLRRAAYTDDKALLFVHAGIDPARKLEDQADTFWWGHAGWRRIDAPYEGFQLVVRGFDRALALTGRAASDIANGPHTLTVDTGCGFGGRLAAVCVLPDGSVAERIDS